jgi:hypothetical protein
MRLNVWRKKPQVYRAPDFTFIGKNLSKWKDF